MQSHERARAAAAAALTLLLAACGGRGGSLPPAPHAAPAGHLASTTLKVHVPAKPRSAASLSRRSPMYVSAYTRSLQITLTASGNPPAVVETTPGAPGCSNDGSGGQVCTVDLQWPIGTQSYLVNAYDGDNAAGHLLSTTMGQATIVADQPNTVTISLTGIVARFGMTLVKNFTLGTPATETLNVAGYDAAGGLIVNSPAYGTAQWPSAGYTSVSINVPSGVDLNAYQLEQGAKGNPATTITAAWPVTGVVVAYDGSPFKGTVNVSTPDSGDGVSGSLTITPAHGAAPTFVYSGTRANGIFGLPAHVASGYGSAGFDWTTVAGSGCTNSVDAMAADGLGNVIVGDACGNVYALPPGSSANGNYYNGSAGAVWTLAAGWDVRGIGFDARHDLYLYQDTGPGNNLSGDPTSDRGLLSVFAPTASGGYQMVDHEVQGYDLPRTMTAGADGTSYLVQVGTASSGDAIVVLAPGAAGTPMSGAAPVRQIGGPNNAQLHGVNQIAVDAAGTIYGVDWLDNRVFAYTSTQDGDVAPARVIQGTLTGLDHPAGLALDGQGHLWVHNRSTVEMFPVGASGNVAPTLIIDDLNAGSGSTMYTTTESNDRNISIVP